MPNIKPVTYAVDFSNNLNPIGFFSNIKYKFSSSYRSEVDNKVKEAVSKRMNSLTGYETAENISNFFKKTVSPISLSQLPRIEIKNHPKYQVVATRLIELDSIASRLPATEKTSVVWAKWAEGQIADAAGIKMVRNKKGTSGSYRVKDLSGKTLGIYKPTSESPHGPHNPHFFIRVRNFFQRLFPINRCCVEEKGPQAEECASRLNDILNWSLVPQARRVQFVSDSLVTRNKEVGSFQLFVEDAKDGYAHFGIWESLPPLISGLFLPKTKEKTEVKLSEESFVKFALLQYLICNIDGNFGNMLFKADSTEINAIDNWFSMPKDHPKHRLDRRGLHPWDRLFWATQAIKPETVALVAHHRDEILAMFDNVYGTDPVSAQIKEKLTERLDFFIGAAGGLTWKQLTLQHHIRH